MTRYIHHGIAAPLLMEILSAEEWTHKIDLRSKFLNSLPPEFCRRRYVQEMARRKNGKTFEGFQYQLFGDYIRDLDRRKLIERGWLGVKHRPNSMWKARLTEKGRRLLEVRRKHKSEKRESDK